MMKYSNETKRGATLNTIDDTKEAIAFKDEFDRFDSEEMEIKFVDEADGYSPMIYEELPVNYQELLDTLASELLDPHGGHIGLVGTSSSGKTFLLHQLVGNIDRYLDKLDRETMHFIHIDDDDMDFIMSLPNRYNTYISAVLGFLDCAERDITFYTEDPNVASRLFNFTKKANIILEASHPTVSNIAHMEHTGATKVWGSWCFIDVNELFLTKKELVNVLHASLNEKILETFKVDIDKRTISTFINYSLKKIPELLGTEGEEKGKVLVPAGVWALIIRRMGGVLGLSESSRIRRNNQIVMTKVYETVFNDNKETLEEYVSNGGNETAIVIPSPDGRSALRIPIPAQLFDQMQMQEEGGSNDDEAPVVAKKLAFGDVSKLGEKLRETIIGQDEAVKTVVESLIVPAAGLNDDTKPLKTMMFLGPTGTGKTKLALTLAENLAEEPMHVVRIDMSEYSERHEAAKLLGAPPGYAGFESGGVLTNAIKKNPNSLILLDEIEKAHPKIWDSFLQIFDAGRMTDGSGETVDFTQTVIVMTSNIGANKISGKTPGFKVLSDEEAYNKRKKDAKSIIMKALEDEFRPELINRIDELVVFNELSLDVSRQIVRQEISIIEERMGANGFSLAEIENDIIDEILFKSNISKYGARDIQRVVSRSLTNPIAKTMATNKKSEDKTVLALTLGDDKNITVSQV